jgi:hypothetical protein
MAVTQQDLDTYAPSRDMSYDLQVKWMSACRQFQSFIAQPSPTTEKSLELVWGIYLQAYSTHMEMERRKTTLKGSPEGYVPSTSIAMD